jgi:mannose/fructose/N-acetylgalactosamine-specific phosphotransferase system component IIC
MLCLQLQRMGCSVDPDASMLSAQVVSCACCISTGNINNLSLVTVTTVCIPLAMLCVQLQRMGCSVDLPTSVALTHMPELVKMEVGTTGPIKLQLVLLPPFACDITPGEHHMRWL